MLKPKRFTKSSFQIALCLTTLSLAVAPGAIYAATITPTPTADPLTVQLSGIAQSNLDAEYNILISGDTTKVVMANLAVTGLAVQEINDATTIQLRRNKILAEHGQHYTKYLSKLTIKDIATSGNDKIIIAQEYDKLTLVNDNSKDQIDTEEVKTHEFHFTLQGSAWSLTEDKIIDQPGFAVPLGGEKKITGQALSLDMTGKHTEPSRSGLGGILPKSITANTVIHGTFNPNNAVNYANNYWGPNMSNYNSAYRVYYDQNSHNLADCTNFVSQAMNWGGWQHIGGWYSDANNWWYSQNPILSWGNKTEAFSWINATYFYFFARYSVRVTNANYLSDFRPGDVLQIMYGGNTSGLLDHSEIVTSKDSSGNIYLTSHAINVHNKSFWDIYAQNPGAKYYGSLMYYQY